MLQALGSMHLSFPAQNEPPFLGRGFFEEPVFLREGYQRKEMKKLIAGPFRGRRRHIKAAEGYCNSVCKLRI